MLLGGDAVLQNTTELFSFHKQRGIQIESTWSGIHMIWLYFLEKPPRLGLHHGAWHDDDLGTNIAIMSTILELLGLCFIYFLSINKKNKERYFAAALLWILAVGPVFSTQYILWALPFLFTWTLHALLQKKKNALYYLAIFLFSLLIAITTHFIFYAKVEQMTPWAITVLNTRNFSIILLCLGLLCSAKNRFFRDI